MRNRLRAFADVPVVLVGKCALRYLCDVAWLAMLPMLLWIAAAWLFHWRFGRDDPGLAVARSNAELTDRAASADLALSLGILAIPVLGTLFAASSRVADRQLPVSLDVSVWLALLGSAWLLVAAASAAQGH